MTQLNAIDIGPRVRNSRAADRRQYHVFATLAFIAFLPFVATRRALPETWVRRRFAERGHGVIDETRAEVHEVLTFLFMV